MQGRLLVRGRHVGDRGEPARRGGLCRAASSDAAERGQERRHEGGTLRVDLGTDYDYIDPALAYFHAVVADPERDAT